MTWVWITSGRINTVATGTISYNALSKGLESFECQFSISNPKIENIVIKTVGNESISITFTLNDVYSQEEAVSITNGLVNVYLDEVAIEFDIAIEEPRCSEFSPPSDEKGNISVSITEYAYLSDTVVCDIRPCKKRIDDLIEKLRGVTQRNDYLRLYRFSAKQRDPFIRFMLLYNILLSLNGDYQEKVDALILSCDPLVSQSTSPINPKKNETIYTRLRNEIGHHRKNVLPEDTMNEIKDNISSFQMIVKKALLKTLP